MVFSSLPFLFFLSAFLVLYYLVPGIKAKNIILLVFSLIFYAWGEPIYIFLMMFSSLVDWLDGRFIQKNPKRKKLYLVIALCVNLGLLGFFKYADFAVEIINSVFGLSISQPEISLPIGISFYTFQTVSYSIDVYRDEAKAEKNYFRYLMYVCMFPQLIAGPIVRYQTIADEIGQRTITKENFENGMSRFLRGFFKKILLANTIGALFTEISALETIPASLAWLGIIAYSLQIFFDFAGYSDMAIGLGLMMGFHFLENFNYPYIAKSITEFWRRWHMSLSTWFRDYVYIPLGGNRVSPARHIVNLLCVWLLTGLWHGAAINFVLWGLYYGVLLILEKYVWGKALSKLPNWVQHIYSLLLIIFGWVLFAFDDFNELGNYLFCMFGKDGFAADSFIYYLRNYGVFLSAGIFCSCPVLGKFLNKEHKPAVEIAISIVSTILFIYAIASLVTGTYNPFLYFRF